MRAYLETRFGINRGGVEVEMDQIRECKPPACEKHLVSFARHPARLLLLIVAGQPV